MKRRQFLAATTATIGMTGLVGPVRAARAADRARNDRLQVGVIGCNGMGWTNIESLLKVEGVDLVAICDVDRSVVESRLADYAELRRNVPASFSDYRELLARDDIDAVVIATPDHWHCRQMLDAVDAGKHVYVEKPVANSIEECRLMVAAAGKAGVVVQTGQWQRSGPHYQRAREIVRSGVLGDIRLVRTWAYQGWMQPVPVLPDEPVPDGVDYGMWLGDHPREALDDLLVLGDVLVGAGVRAVGEQRPQRLVDGQHLVPAGAEHLGEERLGGPDRVDAPLLERRRAYPGTGSRSA